MRPQIDMTGKRFGYLTVIKAADKTKWGSYRYECLCDCGNRKVISGYNLRSGCTRSCGCRTGEFISERMTAYNSRVKAAPIPEVPIDDGETMRDDDLWMFGGHKAVERMKKLLV